MPDTDIEVQGRGFMGGGMRGFPGGMRGFPGGMRGFPGGMRGFPGGMRGFPGRFPMRFPRFRRFPHRFFPFFPIFVGPGFPGCAFIDRFGRCCDRFGRCFADSDFDFPVMADMYDDDMDDDYFV